MLKASGSRFLMERSDPVIHPPDHRLTPKEASFYHGVYELKWQRPGAILIPHGSPLSGPSDSMRTRLAELYEEVKEQGLMPPAWAMAVSRLLQTTPETPAEVAVWNSQAANLIAEGRMYTRGPDPPAPWGLLAIGIVLLAVIGRMATTE